MNEFYGSYYVHTRALRCQDQVHSYCTSHLREACNAFFHVGAFQHHEIGELVNQDQDVWQRLCVLILRFLFVEQAARLLPESGHFAVVLIDIPYAVGCEQLQAPLHLEHGIS